MAHSPDKKIKLRAAYIGGLPLEAAADKVGVPLPTARNWFREARAANDDWDKFRAASLIVSGGGVEQALGRIIAASLMRCEALMEKLSEEGNAFEAVKAMAALGDTISKLKAAGKGMMPEADALSIRVDTVKRLGEFIRTRHPRHAAAFAEILEPFAAELSRG